MRFDTAVKWGERTTCGRDWCEYAGHTVEIFRTRCGLEGRSSAGECSHIDCAIYVLEEEIEKAKTGFFSTFGEFTEKEVDKFLTRIVRLEEFREKNTYGGIPAKDVSGEPERGIFDFITDFFR